MYPAGSPAPSSPYRQGIPLPVRTRRSPGNPRPGIPALRFRSGSCQRLHSQRAPCDNHRQTARHPVSPGSGRRCRSGSKSRPQGCPVVHRSGSNRLQAGSRFLPDQSVSAHKTGFHLQIPSGPRFRFLRSGSPSPPISVRYKVPRLLRFPWISWLLHRYGLPPDNQSVRYNPLLQLSCCRHTRFFPGQFRLWVRFLFHCLYQVHPAVRLLLLQSDSLPALRLFHLSHPFLPELLFRRLRSHPPAVLQFPSVRILLPSLSFHFLRYPFPEEYCFLPGFHQLQEVRKAQLQPLQCAGIQSHEAVQ